MTRGASTLAGFVLFLSALWAGALVFFAAGGAGAVLATAPSRHAAGPVNRALLDLLDVESYGAAVLLLVLVVLASRLDPWSKLHRALAIRLLVVALAATVASHLVITPEMMALRDRMGVIDQIPKSDPLRREWGRLHGLSSIALLVRAFAAGSVFALTFREIAQRFRIGNRTSTTLSAVSSAPAPDVT